MTTNLIEQTLTDPDNDLETIARAFDASKESCWHIDRHITIEVSEATRPDVELLSMACRAALALTRKWTGQINVLQISGLLVSEAFAILDDEWVTGVAGAPPPHVYICLAQNRDSFQPVQHEQAIPFKSSGNHIVDSLLTGRERLFRVEGTFEGLPGAWILKCDPE